MDAYTFKQSLVKRVAKRKINDFLRCLGLDNLQWFVRHNKDLASYLPEAMRQEVFAKVSSYRWVGDVLSAEEIPELLEEDIKAAILIHPNGEQWLKRHIDLLEKLVKGD